MKSKKEDQFVGSNKDQYYEQKNLQDWRKIETYSLFNTVLSRSQDGFKQKVVCDLGCGNGFYGRKCLEKGALSVEGFDLSEDMIQEANKSRIDSSKEQYSVADVLTLGSLQRLKAAFDIVLVVYLWNYSKNTEELTQFMQVAFTLLKSSGVVYVVTDNKKNIPDYSGYQKHGMFREPNFIAIEEERDGLEVDYIFGPSKDKGHRLTNYRMSQKTIENKARHVGFHDIVWHPLELPPELQFNSQDWRQFITEQPIEIYSLSKL